MPRAVTIEHLRRFAVSRSLFAPTTLPAAIARLGFVQADPIRAPARAQDLTLRHRVRGYRAGDLERRYPMLDVEEDVFINYGFMPRRLQLLMHPRASVAQRTTPRSRRVRALLEFVRQRGDVHPRDVQAHFAHGTVTNYWGGSSNATTHLLDLMHYDGLLRVARRDDGIKRYGLAQGLADPASPVERQSRIDALVDVVINKYAPVPETTLAMLVRRLRYAVPQWQREITGALLRSRQRLARARVDGIEWYWPADEPLDTAAVPDVARLLAPFDPVVWDRHRFERFWGWAYRFEAYTPAAKRTRGYYALPLLWRDRIVGWGNLSVRDGMLEASMGYADAAPARGRGFTQALDLELDRMRVFLSLGRAAAH